MGEVKLPVAHKIITVAYKPPNTALELNDLYSIISNNDWLIAAGDFNAKYHMRHRRLETFLLLLFI